MRQLAAAAEELWSVVRQKANQPWRGIAMDARTRHGIALHVGERRRESATQVWAKSPVGSREPATFHPDQDDASTGVMPAARH
jgi:hypothetical protein